jgi:multidrug efflux pump subunit AcrA (membrane-fusion protein)
VSFDALTGRELAATVTEVGVAATGSGTTFPVTVRLDGADAAVRAGMAAEVGFRFGSGDAPGRVRLPAHCVGEDAAGRFVWVLDPAAEGRAVARRRGVSVGELTTEGLTILEGLEDGDRVVTAGVSQVRDGETVRVEVAEVV